jgi:site-specific DNA-methyltransferase (adenine-specific)
VNKAYNELRREERLAEIDRKIADFKQHSDPPGFVDIYNTTKKYNIIYADPPWDYFSDGKFSARLHYRTMTIDEICSLPVKNITAENCALFLWVTFPLLPETFKVIDAWGFKYITCAWCWVKLHPCGIPCTGLGSWTKANAELCLIATKGKVERLDNTISQVIQTVREEHSKKPDQVRELIVRLIGDLPKIELFSRRSVPDWDCWGNETI